jgi:hypothetical protein
MQAFNSNRNAGFQQQSEYRLSTALEYRLSTASEYRLSTSES